MKTVIEINMDNEAFQEEEGGGIHGNRQVAYILRQLAYNVQNCHFFDDGWSCALRDVNGNEVGFCAVREG